MQESHRPRWREVADVSLTEFLRKISGVVSRARASNWVGAANSNGGNQDFAGAVHVYNPREMTLMEVEQSGRAGVKETNGDLGTQYLCVGKVHELVAVLRKRAIGKFVGSQRSGRLLARSLVCATDYFEGTLWPCETKLTNICTS
jgi:hypothetical protein